MPALQYFHHLPEIYRKLAEVLHSVEGKVAISGYHCQLFDTLYQDWYCIDDPAKKSSFNKHWDRPK